MIVKMKKLRLLAMKPQRDELLRQLQLMGCVEVSEPEKNEYTEGLERVSTRLAEYREEHRELSAALALIDRYASVKDGMFAARPLAGAGELTGGDGAEQLRLAGHIIGLDERIKKLSAEEMDVKNSIDALAPWLSLDIPLDCTGTKSSGVVIGSIPASVDIQSVKSELASQCELSELYEISSDREQHCVEVVFHRSQQEGVMAALRGFWFSPMALAGRPGTARENSDRAGARLGEIGSEKAALAAEIAAEKGRRDELKLAIDRADGLISRAEAADRLLATQSTVVLTGWVPADAEAALGEKLAGFDCAWETEDPSPDESADVPIKLRNNVFTEPMTALTQMYSLPAYNGVDPNPLMLPFFPLYFGIMFADLAYGLLLTFGGIFLYGKTKKRGGTMKYFGGMMIECGVMASIFGALTGGFFGDAPTQVAAMFGIDFVMPALIQPIEDPLPILVLSLVLGIIQMLFAVCVNGWLIVRDGSKADAFWEVAPVFVVFVGLALGALGISWIPEIVGIVMVVYAQGRASESIGGKIGNGIYGLYSFVSGWFGDVLSYSRLMALMLSGSVIAQVFNSLGAMGGPVVFVLVFLIGHALNIALNLIGCFVHALRLQYLEYFGKFYREGGKPFTPLAVKTKYVDIKED